MLPKIIFFAIHLYASTAVEQILGFAIWHQNAYSQSNAEQDELMVLACLNTYSKANSVATHDELVEMGIENTSGKCLIGACGDRSSCEGIIHEGVVDGISRNCWVPNSWTSTAPVDHCRINSQRSTLCVFRVSSSPTAVPSEGPSSPPTEIQTPTPTEWPSPSPTEMPTVIPTEWPSISPTENPTPTQSEMPTELPTVTPTNMVIPSVSPTNETLKPSKALAATAPTNAPSEQSTFKQTFLPTAYPTEDTGTCPETVRRLEVVIDYLLDYVFCLKHEEEKDKCNGSRYMN